MANGGATAGGSQINVNTSISLGGGGSSGAMDDRTAAIRQQELEIKASTAADYHRNTVLAEQNTIIKQATLDEKKRNNAVRESTAATNQNARSSIMLSVSMFVTVLIIRQMTNAFVALGKAMGLNKEDTQELTKTINAMNGALALTVGPIQIYMMWTMVMKAENASLARSFIGLGAAIGASYFLLQAIITDSKELAAAYTLMAGGLFTLTLVMWAYNAAKAAKLELDSLGMASPVVIAAIGAAATVAAAAVVYLAKAETAEGSYRTVQRSGQVYVHAGEKIGRITPQETNNTIGRITPQETNNTYGSRSVTIISNDPYRTAKMVERYDRRGVGRKRVRRMVA